MEYFEIHLACMNSSLFKEHEFEIGFQIACLVAETYAETKLCCINNCRGSHAHPNTTGAIIKIAPVKMHAESHHSTAYTMHALLFTSSGMQMRTA